MSEEATKPDALLWLDFETTGIDRASSLPLEVGMECTDVLGDHLGDFDSEGGLEPCINGHGRIVCGCGWMTKGPDIEDWYDHLAAAMEDGLDSVAAEVVGGHGPDSEPGE